MKNQQRKRRTIKRKKRVIPYVGRGLYINPYTGKGMYINPYVGKGLRQHRRKKKLCNKK